MRRQSLKIALWPKKRLQATAHFSTEGYLTSTGGIPPPFRCEAGQLSDALCRQVFRSNQRWLMFGFP